MQCRVLMNRCSSSSPHLTSMTCLLLVRLHAFVRCFGAILSASAGLFCHPVSGLRLATKPRRLSFWLLARFLAVVLAHEASLAAQICQLESAGLQDLYPVIPAL